MTQTERLKQLLDDGKPHRTDEILRAVYGSEHAGIARVSARVYDLKKTLPDGWAIESWPDKERRTLTYYQLKPPSEPQLGLFGGVTEWSTVLLLLLIPWWLVA